MITMFLVMFHELCYMEVDEEYDPAGTGLRAILYVITILIDIFLIALFVR